MFGQTIIMILIEIGGLGFMSFTTLIAIILGKKITLRERLILQDAMNTFNIQGLVKWLSMFGIYGISSIFWGIIIINSIYSRVWFWERGFFIACFILFQLFVMLDLMY